MSDLNQSVFQATEYIVRAYLDNLKFDRTIIAEIVRLNNAEIGEYVIKYEGNEMMAYVTDITNVYQPGDSICVRVQESDFSKQKFIERKNENKKKGVGQLKTSMIEVESSSPNLIEPIEPLALTVGTEPLFIMQEKIKEPIGQYSFKDYAKMYNTIQISALFTTSFMSEHSKGNYGIEIALKTSIVDEEANNSTVEILRLDLQNFIGNPYHCETGVLQTAQFNIIKDYYTGIAYIKFFQEGFEQDVAKIVNEDGTISEIEINTPNLEVKDISINFVNIVDYSQIDYYVDIKTPDGTRTEVNKPIKLQANLKYRGQNILTKDDCICYWFKQNFAITPGNEKYNNNAGSGWELINTSNEFVPELIIYSKEAEGTPYVGRDQEFKLVIKYKEDNYFTDTVLIEDGTESLNAYSLKQEVYNENISLYIETNNNEKVMGDWYRLSSNGIYEKINEEKVSKIDITQYLVNTLNTFYCAIYGNQEFKCNRTIVIKNSEEASDFLVSFEGKDIFSYDSKGNTDYENTEIEQIIIPHIQMANAATKFTMEWYLGETKLNLNNEEFEPLNSMIQNIWYDDSMRVHFKIKQKFNNSYTNNTLVLKLKLLNSEDKVYEYPKELMFTKDGSQDSNGSTYNLVVRAINGENNIIPMNQFIGVKSSKGSALQLKAILYKDGEEIENPLGKINWSIKYGKGQFNVNNKGQFILNEVLDYNVVKAEYVQDKIYLSYLFPINTYTNVLSDFSFQLPQIIRYDASGYKPDYSQLEIKIPEGYTLSLSDNNYVNLSNEKSNLKLIVSEQFDGELDENKFPYYIIQNGENIYKLPIVLQLNTVGNENIMGWDGESVNLGTTSTVNNTQVENKVYAPQVGAGEVDSDGKFNGVIMGKDNIENQLGLYGYQKGNVTFGLKQDGKVFFGNNADCGRLEFDGKNGTISGGGGGNKPTGMTIMLSAEGEEDLAQTKAIQIGNDKFYIQYDGYLASMYGTVGGWNLGIDELYNGKNQGLWEHIDKKDGVPTQDGLFSTSAGEQTTTIINKHGIFTESLEIHSAGTQYCKKFVAEGINQNAPTGTPDGGIYISGTTQGGYHGKIGYIPATRGSGIGISTHLPDNPIIVETDQSNLRLTAGTTDSSIHSVILESEHGNNGKYSFYLGSHVDPNNDKVYYNLYCDVPADKQYGIYARFA